MDIKTIRQNTDLTQKEFAERYRIPLQTLKQWESDPESSSYRKPPDYIVYLLGRQAGFDYAGNGTEAVSREEHLMDAAERSRNDAKLWFRYLRKEFVDGKTRLTPEQIAVILNSGRLSMFQRISLLRAIEPGTPTNKHVLGLNERAKTPMMDELMRRRNNVG